MRCSSLISASLLGLLASGCSIPLDVYRVADPSAEVRGVRFLVRRPAYQVALRLDETQQKCQFRLAIEQTLDGPPIEYEAVGRDRLLATTHLSITEDLGGELESVSAGESDETHEIVAGLAGIATSFAPIPAGRVSGESCEGLPADGKQELSEYIAVHRAMAERVAVIRAAASRKLASVDERTGSAKLRSIEALAELADALENELAHHAFPLSSKRFRVVVASAGEESPPIVSAVEGPWFTIVLTPEQAR